MIPDSSSDVTDVTVANEGTGGPSMKWESWPCWGTLPVKGEK